MRLDLKIIANVFNQVFVGDDRRRRQLGMVIEDVTGGLDVSAHTVVAISQSHSVEFRVKPAVSSAQAVKLDPYFARRVASSWRVSKTRDVWLQRAVAYAENFHGGFQSAKIFLCTKIESMIRKNIKQAAIQYVNVVKQL